MYRCRILILASLLQQENDSAAKEMLIIMWIVINGHFYRGLLHFSEGKIKFYIACISRKFLQQGDQIKFLHM